MKLNSRHNIPCLMLFLNPLIFIPWIQIQHSHCKNALQTLHVFAHKKLTVAPIDMPETSYLTHWGRVTHICVSNPTIIGSDNGLSPSRRQAIIWTNVGLLLIRPLGTNFSEMLIEIHIFSFKKMYFKWWSGKWRPFCPGLNVLRLCVVKKYFHISLLVTISVYGSVFC